MQKTFRQYAEKKLFIAKKFLKHLRLGILTLQNNEATTRFEEKELSPDSQGCKNSITKGLSLMIKVDKLVNDI